MNLVDKSPPQLQRRATLPGRRSAALQGRPAAGRAPPDIDPFAHSPRATAQRARAAALQASPRSTLQQVRVQALHGTGADHARQADRVETPHAFEGSGLEAAEAVAPPVAAAQRQAVPPHGPATTAPPANAAPVLQGKIKASTLKRIGIGVLRGLVNAVAPFFAGYDYAENLHKIHTDRTGAGALYGHGMGLSILAGLKETAQLVATVTTAAGILFGIASIFVPPVAAAATVAGVVATAAHLVTLALRAVSTGTLVYRLQRTQARDHQRRGALKAQIYTELGGMAGNVLGVIFGGLGGGFTPQAASNPLNALAGGKTAAYLALGQVGNSAADAAGGVGAAKARGAEHEAERRAAASAAAARDDASVHDDSVVAEDDTAVDAPGPRASDASESDVDDSVLEQARDALPALARLAEDDARGAADTQAALHDDLAALEEGRRHVAEVAAQAAPARDALAVAEALDDAAMAPVAAQDPDAVQAALGQMQAAMPEAAAEEADSDTETESDTDDAVAAEPAADPAVQEDDASTTDTEADDAVHQTKPAPGAHTGRVGTPPVQAQGFGHRLMSRLFGVGRRLRRSVQQVKARFVGAALRLLGLEAPARQAQAEMAQEQARVPAALATQQGLQDGSSAAGGQLTDAAQGIRQLLDDPGGPAR